MEKKEILVALVGNPNSGKTSLFNKLVGANQKVGNFSGVTVEKYEGIVKHKDFTIKIIDLPGTYSLFSKSIDEEVAQQILCNKDNSDYPDITLVVADASNLRRSIFLLTQIIDLKMNVVLALNMVDIATKKGLIVDVNLLSKKLGIPVVAINARKGKGIEVLKKTVINSLGKSPDYPFLDVGKLFKGAIQNRYD